jgi:N-ethylmaleimide reductase
MAAPDDQPLAMLLTPFRRGSMNLANRVVMAPMSRNRADAHDAAHALTATYYAQRATAGLIVTEASPIAPGARTALRAPGIYSVQQIDGWRLVTRAVHDAGGTIFIQLWHAGRISHSTMQPDGQAPAAPSPIAPQGSVGTGAGTYAFETPRALAAAEIAEIVSQFGAAARNAKLAGFDGVEIHAANGYLIDQFLRDGANRRSDSYGGTIANRVRFLLDAIDAVTAVWSGDRVGVRLSPASSLNGMADSDPQATFGHAVDALSRRRLAFLHADETTDVPFDWAAFRRRYGGIYIANGGYDRARAAAAIASGHADLVSFGRLYLANPDLVARFRADAPLNPPDRSTFYGGDRRGYTDYPTLAQSSPSAR